MSKNVIGFMMSFLLFGVISTGIMDAETVSDTIFDRKALEQKFAFGADVGFVSQMESWGTKWLDKNGKQKDVLQILKEQGINNVRLRIWVNPSGGWCGKKDVVKMAKRAHAMGMGVMLSFHYSDTWADPGTQECPAAWKDHTVDQLEQDVYDHTKDVIMALQEAGITPRWVQIGNETKRGMFYPTCQTNKGGMDNFACMLKSGIKAVKECDSTIQTIIHLPDGHDNSLFRNMFDALRIRGVVWDMIGMSAYPRWSHLDCNTMITKVMANIKDLEQRYGTKVMVVETGHYWDKPLEANQYLAGLMDQLIKNGDPGCFYWEPESMSGYDLGAWDHNTKRPTIAMDAFLGVKYSEVPWVIRASMTVPEQGATVPGETELRLSANVEHIRNRNVGLDFYVDKKNVGRVTSKPFELSVQAMQIGVHIVFAHVTDDEKHEQTTDTVTFFVGESTLLKNSIKHNTDQRGGTQQWNIYAANGGQYLLLLHYSTDKAQGAIVTANSDTLSRIYFFTKGDDMYMNKKIELPASGMYTLTLSATSINGLPAINDIRIFPLDGQLLPVEGIVSNIDAVETKEDNVILYVYTLSGQFVGRFSEHQLGLSLGGRDSAVVVLPNCVGGTPNIVRKHRLK